MNRTRYQLSQNYPKILGVFGAWTAIGIALTMFGTGQYLLGGLLTVLGVILVAQAIRGGRRSDRPYSRTDLVVQWIILAIPIVLAIIVLFIAVLFFRPFAIYVTVYLAGLVVLAAMAIRELRKRVSTNELPEGS